MHCSILVFVVALAAVSALPIELTQNQNNNAIVPGVFISSETLKELQDKAQTNQNSAITNQNSIRNLSPNSEEPLKVSAQNTNQNQATVISQAQAQAAVAQQPGQFMVAQPSQAAGLVLVQQQPSNQQPAVLVQQQPTNQQPAVLVQQQPTNQQPAVLVQQQPSNQQLLVQQPSNQQPVLVQQQPANQQPIYISQQPQPQQIVLSNGQVTQLVPNSQPVINGQTLVNGQPLLYSTNPGSNQLTLIQNPRPQTSNGVQYAVVPVNQNNVAQSTNLPSGNTYVMVPGSNQLYTISG